MIEKKNSSAYLPDLPSPPALCHSSFGPTWQQIEIEKKLREKVSPLYGFHAHLCFSSFRLLQNNTIDHGIDWSVHRSTCPLTWSLAHQFQLSICYATSLWSLYFILFGLSPGMVSEGIHGQYIINTHLKGSYLRWKSSDRQMPSRKVGDRKKGVII